MIYAGWRLGFVATARGAPIPCAHHARVWSGDTLDSSGRGSGTERFKSFHDEPLGVALAIGHCRHDPHGNKLSQAAPYRGPFTKGRIVDLSTGAAKRARLFRRAARERSGAR